MQGVRGIGVPASELVEDDGDVLDAEDEVSAVGGLLHGGEALATGDVLPNGGVAAGMLEEDGEIASWGPVAAQVGGAGAGAAEAVAEEDDGGGVCGCGEVDAERDVALAGGVVNGEVEGSDVRGIGEAERVVVGVGGTGGRGENQSEKEHVEGAISHGIAL